MNVLEQWRARRLIKKGREFEDSLYGISSKREAKCEGSYDSSWITDWFEAFGSSKDEIREEAKANSRIFRGSLEPNYRGTIIFIDCNSYIDCFYDNLL